MHVTIVNHSADWIAAALGAGAAIIGALVVMVGGLLTERLRHARLERDTHVAYLTDFSAVVQMWGTFVFSYPNKSTSKNPIAVAAHNFDLRLTQRQWLQQMFHLNELLWRAAMSAMAAATDEELDAITTVLGLTGQFRVGEPPPEVWPQASSHITYLAREARRQRRSRFGRLHSRASASTQDELQVPAEETVNSPPEP